MVSCMILQHGLDQNISLRLKHIKLSTLLIFFCRAKYAKSHTHRKGRREVGGRGKEGGLAKSYSDVLLSFVEINR